jgi:hypothetical protein
LYLHADYDQWSNYWTIGHLIVTHNVRPSRA